MRRPTKDDLLTLNFGVVVFSASYGLFAHACVTGEIFFDVGFVPLSLLCTAAIWSCIATGMIAGPQLLSNAIFDLIFPNKPTAGSSGNGRYEPSPNKPRPRRPDLVKLFHLNQLEKLGHMTALTGDD